MLASFYADSSWTFEVSSELHGHLDQDLDPWHELSQDVERSWRDEAVDDCQAAVVVEGPDVKHDLVQAGRSSLGELQKKRNKKVPENNATAAEKE